MLPEQELLRSVIVIDNASSDDSMEQAETAAEGAKQFSFVRSGENLGFARANNIGIKRIGKETQDHILLLNPDTELTPGALKSLYNTLKQNPDVGVVGPKLLNSDGSLQESVRQLPSFVVLAGIFLKLHRLLPQDPVWQRYFMRNFDYTAAEKVPQVMGACFLIRREALEKVGLLDQRFWVWFEEVDFCKRAVNAGWDILYTPAASVIHYGGASFHQLTGWKKAWPFIRSSLVYATKHFSFIAAILLATIVPFATLLTIPAMFRHRALVKEVKSHT